MDVPRADRDAGRLRRARSRTDAYLPAYLNRTAVAAEIQAILLPIYRGLNWPATGYVRSILNAFSDLRMRSSGSLQLSSELTQSLCFLPYGRLVDGYRRSTDYREHSGCYAD